MRTIRIPKVRKRKRIVSSEWMSLGGLGAMAVVQRRGMAATVEGSFGRVMAAVGNKWKCRW